MSDVAINPVKHIRINNPHVLRLVERERVECGEVNATRTAERLIIERITLKEASVSRRVEAPPEKEPSAA